MNLVDKMTKAFSKSKVIFFKCLVLCLLNYLTYAKWSRNSLCVSGGVDWLCNGESARDCDAVLDTLSSDQYHQYNNGKHKQQPRRLDPEYWKTIISSVYVVFVFGFTSFVMVIVHERVPDMRTYPPLPDIFLDRWFDEKNTVKIVKYYYYLK